MSASVLERDLELRSQLADRFGARFQLKPPDPSPCDIA
jgi:hypothetical protein